jgi:hypothetical protein
MTLPVLIAPERPNGADDRDELTHYYCCNEDLALCGADISMLPKELEPGQIEAIPCQVCVLLTVCSRCGESLESPA